MPNGSWDRSIYCPSRHRALSQQWDTGAKKKCFEEHSLRASLSKSFKNICCFLSKVLLISQFLLLCFPREKLNVARLAAHGFRKNSNQLQSCKKARKSHSSNIFFHGLGTCGERLRFLIRFPSRKVLTNDCSKNNNLWPRCVLLWGEAMNIEINLGKTARDYTGSIPHICPINKCSPAH